MDALLAAGTALEVTLLCGMLRGAASGGSTTTKPQADIGAKVALVGLAIVGRFVPSTAAALARLLCAVCQSALREKSGRRMASSAWQLLPAVSQLLCVQVFVIYSYAEVGVSLYSAAPPADAVVPGKKGFGGGGEPELELNAAFSSVPIALWTCFHMLAGSKWDELIKEAANAGGSHAAGALPPRLRDAVASAYFFSFQFVAVLLVLNIICSVVAELTDHLADDDDPYAAAASEVALFDEAGVQQHIVQLWKDASSSRWRRIIAEARERAKRRLALRRRTPGQRQPKRARQQRRQPVAAAAAQQRRAQRRRRRGAAGLAGNSPQGFRSGAVAGLMLHLQRSSSQIIEAAASDVGTPRSPLSPLATTAIDEDSGSTRSPRPRTRAAAARSPRLPRSPSRRGGRRAPFSRSSQRPPFSP